MTVDDLLDGHFSAGSENEDEDVLDQVVLKKIHILLLMTHHYSEYV